VEVGRGPVPAGGGWSIVNHDRVWGPVEWWYKVAETGAWVVQHVSALLTCLGNNGKLVSKI
jgi:hypothetical protein